VSGDKSTVLEDVEEDVLINEINSEAPPDKAKEIMAGLVSSLATMSYAICCSNMVGVNPLVGIWSAFFIAICCALVNGRPGLISGASLAVAIPLADVFKKTDRCVLYLHATMKMAASLIALTSVFKLGKFISFVTDPAYYGFMNGLAYYICKSQVKFLLHLRGAQLISSLCVIVGTAAGVYLFPKVTSIPSSLLSVVLASVICHYFKVPVRTLSCNAVCPSVFKGGFSVLPKFTRFIPPVPLTLETFKIITLPALDIVVVTALQSLLGSRIVAQAPKICASPDTDNDKVLMGTAVGNFVSGMFGGIGGCGLLPYTALNVDTGGRGSLSSLTAALALGFYVLFLGPAVGRVPIPALGGLMLTVAFKTLKWKETFKYAKKAIKGDVEDKFNLIAILLASFLCAFVDLAEGIFAGVIMTQIGKKISSLQKNQAAEKEEQPVPL